MREKTGEVTRTTASEARAYVAAGRGRTDWERVRAMTDEEIDAAIAADPDMDLPPEGLWEDSDRADSVTD